ncbi:MAG: DUF695 domain-containing protein [Halioglobus sp.]
MTEDDWDFYFCEVDSEPASIYLNLGLRQSPPVTERPVMAYARIRMPNPRQDGLCSDEDFEALAELEDLLVAGVAEKLDALFVGRNTSSGTRDFYFYLVSEDDWVETVRGVLDQTALEHQAGCRADPEWEVYGGFLYPSGRERQEIQNRRVCDVLESQGDALQQARDIDHWIHFKTSDARSRFENEVTELGFSVRSRGEPSEESVLFSLQIFRMDELSRENIDKISLELFDVALELDADYDGWEASVVVVH